MCTLIAAFRYYGDSPLVIAANRDESLRRPSSGPRIWDGTTPFLAPVDEQAGGTWLGLNGAGVFVGVTNRFGAARDPSRESRGLLVQEALASRNAETLHGRLRALSPTRFNAFHLFYADGANAYVTWSDGERITHEVLEPGIHVITERSYAAEPVARAARAREVWPKAPRGSPTPPLGELAKLLAIHDPADPLGSLCVHVPSFDYGTRSSFLLKLGREGIAGSELWSSDVPPCERLPTPRPELVEALR